MHRCSGDESTSVAHVSGTTRDRALLAGRQVNVVIGPVLAGKAAELAGEHAGLLLGPKPELVRVVLEAETEVVDLGVGVELVDVVVKVTRGVLRVGVQDHAAVGTLEDHLPEGNLVGDLVGEVALEHCRAALAVFVQDKAVVGIAGGVLALKMLLQVGFGDAGDWAELAAKVAGLVDLVPAMAIEMILEVFALGKHLATNVTKESGRDP